MEIDRRRIRRLIRESHPKERTFDRVVRKQAWLDPLGEAVQKAVGAFYDALGSPGRSVKNVMHGTNVLGHPLHPAITDVPIGAWSVGVLADWLFVATGRVPAVAGDLGLGLGVAAAILAALTGLTDHHETEGHERRMATLHGMAMTLVLVIDLVSVGLRLWAPGMRLSAIALATVGGLLAMAAAYAGGPLPLALGTGVNPKAFVRGPRGVGRGAWGVGRGGGVGGGGGRGGAGEGGVWKGGGGGGRGAGGEGVGRGGGGVGRVACGDGTVGCGGCVWWPTGTGL